MKRQETVSLDRIKRPGPVALTKPERMLCAQSKPVNEPPFGAVFCCTQLISASRYEGRARPPRRRSSTVLWRRHWEIIDIQPAYCTIMICFDKMCRLTPALLIFHEIFETLWWKFWCEKSADFQGMEGMNARKSVTGAKNQQALFQNRENVVKRHLPCSDDFLNGILTRRCKIREIICIKCCLEYGISTR